jgi:DNA replication protein DnaC
MQRFRTIGEGMAAAIQTALAVNSNRPREIKDDEICETLDRIARLGYEPSEQIVEPIRAYLQGYGILLTGEAGVGKTFLLSCLGVRLYVADVIASYGLVGIHEFFAWTDGHEICIDDLGSERTTVEYGNRDDVLKAVLAHRERDPKNRTHITTNLTAAQIAERYGDRTLSRVLGMCKAFQLQGGNRRKPATQQGEQ